MKILKILLILLAFSGAARSQTIPSWKIGQLQNYITKSDSVLVINFWATFCKPCLEELPYYKAIIEKYKNKKVKLLMVSMDLKDAYPEKIKEFVQQNKYTNPVVWLNETNADYFCPKVDKSWMGGIPSTFIVNSKTGYKKFFEKQMKPDEFETELQKAL